jgi:hypothetical protein
LAYLSRADGEGDQMAKCIPVIALSVVLSVATGCDTERISRLEKQNDELKAEIKKSQAAADYDLQAKCAKDSRAWFKENWSADKDTILLDFTNHYNKALNKCFILVEYHFRLDKNGSWVNDMKLWDVYENSRYGSFAENNMMYFKPTLHPESSVITCEVVDAKCKTIEEFNNLIRPYLNN